MNNLLLNDIFYIAIYIDNNEEMFYVSKAKTMYGSHNLSKEIEVLNKNDISEVLESSSFFKHNLIIFECSLITKSKLFHIGKSISIDKLKMEYDSLISFNELDERLRNNNRKKDIII